MKPNVTSPISYELADAETVFLEQAAVMTSKLSHDFSNYLTGIMGFTELSLLQAPAGSTQQRFLLEVLQSAKAGADWVQRLHRFCRRTNFPGWPTCIGLALAEEQARRARDQRNGMVWRINLSPNLPMVAVDAESLGIVLRELIANSSEATADKGTLDIQARAVILTESDGAHLLGSPVAGEYVEWSVCDDGDSIAPQVREKLLTELFFSTKPKHRGLGLWMIYGLIKRHTGGIRLFSSSPERGFGVSMFLPVAKVPKFANSAENLAILLMLADPTRSANMGKVLEISGCLPTIASSSVDALEMVTNRPDRFAVAVIETQLGDESGVSLARRMQARSAGVRFVFLHPQMSYQGLGEDDLVKRFPLLRGPLEMSVFFQALADAIRFDAKKGK